MSQRYMIGDFCTGLAFLRKNSHVLNITSVLKQTEFGRMHPNCTFGWFQPPAIPPKLYLSGKYGHFDGVEFAQIEGPFWPFWENSLTFFSLYLKVVECPLPFF